MSKTQTGLQMLFLVPVLIILSCSSAKDKSAQSIQNVESVTHESAIPTDVTYTVINEEKIPEMKRSVDVRLNRKVSKEVLEALGNKIKNQDSSNYERTFVGYYLPGMKVNAGYWATTHFNPNLEVRILGLPLEQENGPPETVSDPSREIVGIWIQEEQPLPGRVTIFSQDGSVFMEKTFRDGSVSKDKMVEQASNDGRKFMKATRTRAGDDYYLIDKQGNLQLWSQDFDGSYVLVVTAMKIEN